MKKRMIILIMLLVLGVTAGNAYHYQSRRSGGWHVSTWVRSSNGVDNWKNASSPNSGDKTIRILNGHAVTLGAFVTIDETTIEQGGSLNIGGAAPLTINNGPGIDFTIKGTLTGSGRITNNSDATIEVLSGNYNHSGTLENDGIIIIHNNQLTGNVNNRNGGLIQSNRTDIMRSGTLTNHDNSTIEYTAVINIPASTSYKRLKLSAPGIYYLTGNVTNLEYLELGPYTYLHKNNHNLDQNIETNCNAPERIIDNSIVTFSSSNPAVGLVDMSRAVTKHPIYKFVLNKDSNEGAVQFTGLSFKTTGDVASGDILRYQLWGGNIDNINATGAAPLDEIATNALGIGEYTFEGFTDTLKKSSMRHYWITADVKNNATLDKTIYVDALNSADFTISDATVIGKYENVHNGSTQIITGLNTVLSDPNQVPERGISKGSAKNPVYQFQLQSTGENELKGLSFTGTGINSTNFSKFELYGSATDNLSTAAHIADYTVSNGNSSNSNGETSYYDFDFENKDFTLLSGQKYFFWITVDVNSGADISNKLTINALTGGDFTLEGSITGETDDGGEQTIVDPGTTLASSNPAVPEATISRGSNKNPIYAFNLTSRGSNTLNTVTFTPIGDNQTTNISQYQLYSSTSASFDSAIKIGNDINASATEFSFGSLDQPLTDGIKRYFWITADIKKEASVNDKIQVNALSSENFDMATGTVEGTAFDGEELTIGYPLLIVRTTNPAIASGTVNVNSARNPVYRFSVIRDDAAGDVEINSLTFTTEGTYESDNLARFRLGRSNVDICTTAQPVDWVGITGDLSPGEQTFEFKSPLKFTSNSTSYFWISAVTDSAEVQGPNKTIQVKALTEAGFVLSNGRVNVKAYDGQIQTIGNVQVFIDSAPIPPNEPISPIEDLILAPGHKKHPIQRFTLNSCGNVTIRHISFNTTGTYNDRDITRFQLWTGIEDDFSAAGQIGTDITTDLGFGSYKFEDVGLALFAGQLHYFWITTDASHSLSSGNTITVSPLTASDITASFGTPTGSSNSGGEHTFTRLNEWTNAKTQTINTTANAGSDYQIKVVVHRGSGADDAEKVYTDNICRNDFGDIRFFENGIPLDFWMESCTYAEKATFWVKLKGDLSSGDIKLTMHYGNKGATTTSDGTSTFDFFDDFNRNDESLDKWNKHKTEDNSTISIPKGTNHVRLGDCGTGGNFGHVVLGSDRTYNDFINGSIEFRYRNCVDAIAEVGFRGTFGPIGTDLGYKVRSDARTDETTQNGGQSFLKPPYYDWEHLNDSMDSFSDQPEAHKWYRGQITAFDNHLAFYRADKDNTILASSSLASYHGAGEISLQNHYGNKVDFDWVFVRKYANAEPTREDWKTSPIAKNPTAISHDGFTAHWNTCPNTRTYFIDVIKDGEHIPLDGWENHEVTTNTNAIRVEGLEAGKTYKYRVRSVCMQNITSENSNTITLTTKNIYDGYAETTSILGKAVTANIPPVEHMENNDVIISEIDGGETEDFIISISYHSGGYSIWPNGRLLASIKSTSISALNRSYTIYHDGMITPAVAAWRLGDADEDWHYFSEDDVTFTDEYTTVTISGIEPMRSEPVLEILLNDGSPTLPVELSSFTAKINAYGKITIEWVTQTETNLMGYRIYRNNLRDLDSATLLDALIEARNTSQTQVYTYSDNELLEPGNYFYWLESVDFDGTMQYYGPVRVEINDSDTNNQVPIIAGINHTYPNPFNPDIHIAFGVPEPAKVKMIIYNIRGQRVSEILNEDYGKGNHTFTWTGTDDRGRQLSSGLYFLRMEMDKKTWIKKIIMSK